MKLQKPGTLENEDSLPLINIFIPDCPASSQEKPEKISKIERIIETVVALQSK
jgi:hypothetical protein